ELGGDVTVRKLFVGKHDVERHRLLVLFPRAAVGRLHDRRTAARADDEVALALFVLGATAGEPGKVARNLVIARLGLEALGHGLGGTCVDLGGREDALGRVGLTHRQPTSAKVRQRHAAAGGCASLRALQSIRRVAYITPASATKSRSEPISSENASRLSRM